jgi:general secretion pathway protein J
MRRRGFTLIEVMVASAILAVVSTLVWSSFKETFHTKKAVEDQSVRYRTVRVALERMSREISMAYLSQNEVPQTDPRTIFAGKRHGSLDELRFSYFGHQRLYQDANEADTAQVVYFTDRNRDDSRKTDLYRRETRRLQYLKPDDQPNEADVVCDDIVGLRFDYWDARDKQWREEWVTSSADGQPDRLPGRVKITLTVHDERGKEVPFQTEVRIAMTEPLQSRAVDPQAGPGGTTAAQCGASGQACCTTPGTSPCQSGLSCGKVTPGKCG